MGWNTWLIDASASDEMFFAFVPVELDDSGEIKAIVYGMMLITDKPEGKVIGVTHPDGQEAVDEWCAKNTDRLNAFFEDAA